MGWAPHQIRGAFHQAGMARGFAHGQSHSGSHSRDGGKHFVDLQLSTVNQNGEEVLSGYASARIRTLAESIKRHVHIFHRAKISAQA